MPPFLFHIVAFHHFVQVHTMGTATVTVSWKQQAKQYCLKLQEFGLTTSIAPDPSA